MPNAATTSSDAHAGKAEPKFTNLLASETSPYLLQHAHNPVNWRPWGPEAFEAARAADKSIFLSIGYSTCYWCHVMERESFENEAIAAIMNEHFICIKVDREERPDVDDIYMTATQLMTGSGGWPMSVWLEPHSLKPFLAGTYFPPEDRHGLAGFPRVLEHIGGAWTSQREAILQQADRVAGAVEEHLSRTGAPVPIGQQQVDLAIAQLMRMYDTRDGGFVGSPRRAPKFPTPSNLDLLIGAAWDDETAQTAVTHTLDRMATGGLFDQVGGGFHRYSVDEKWLVPHFEKMLYDNAQLASTYSRAFELTKDEFYAHIVRRTLDYVLREMTSPSGGFFSAQDAEVNAREGQNYLWTAEQVRSVLEANGLSEDIEFVLDAYGLNEGPNFRDPHHADDPPSNVLFLADTPERLAQRMSISVEEVYARLDRINNALLESRNKRNQPGTDDKVLAGWNGLMIAGMADGGRVLGEKRYVEAASKAARFVLESMKCESGGLLRTWRSGEARIDAFLEDYALMIFGLLRLHQATNDRQWLDAVESLTDSARTLFWDEAQGGYFDTRANQSDLFVRTKSMHDGAVPCGNSVMIGNLLKLHELTESDRYLDDARAALAAMSPVIARQPIGPALATLALSQMNAKGEPSLVGDQAEARSQPVQVVVEPDELGLKPNGSGEFTITLRIAEGLHINAHEPGIEDLIPLEVAVVGGAGVAIEVEYPPAKSITFGLGGDAINVHEDEAIVRVQLRRTGAITGRPQLVLTYQACTDKVCLEPVTQVLPVKFVAVE